MKGKEGSISELWSVAYPLIISTASLTVMHFFNRLFLSWYSTDAISACVPAGVLSFNMLSFFFGVSTYTNVLVAQYFGNRQYDRMTLSLWQGVFFSLISAVIILFLIPVGTALIHSSNHPAHIKLLEADYFTILLYGGGLPVLNNALSAFFTGQGKTKITMLVNMFGNGVNILLSYVLIFGAGPVPSLGMNGAAYAMITGNAVMTVAFLALIFSPENRTILKTGMLFKFHKLLFMKLLKFGLPTGVGMVLEIASFSAFIFLIGNAGKIALAANNIVFSIEMISFMSILGIGTATSTLVGQHIGKNRKDHAVLTTYSAFKLSMAITGTLGLLFILFPDVFVAPFQTGKSAETHAIFIQTRPLMRILAFFIICDAINIIFASTIKGAGDTRYQMIVSMILAWLFFVPGAYILLGVLEKPIEYAWVWATLYLLIQGIVFYLRFKSNKWQNIDMLSLDSASSDKTLQRT